MAKSRYKAWFAYQKGFELAGSIFRMTQNFPKEETYSLVDQIRRSSRSVCANLAECYGQRHYPRYFQSKLTIAIAENFETQTWLDFALDSEYISYDIHCRYVQASEEVGKLLSYMATHPDRYVSNVRQPKIPND